MHGVIPEAPACDFRRAQALRGVSKGDTRSGDTRGMGKMVSNAVKNLSEREVVSGRRVPGGMVIRPSFILWRVGAAMPWGSSHYMGTYTDAGIWVLWMSL